MARLKPAQVTEELSDVWRLIVGYTKQELQSPLRGLLEFMRWGVMAMVCFAVGAGFASVAIVRALQTETDAFDGNWSMIPYVASIVGCGIVLGLAVRSVAKTPWKEKSKGGSS